VAKEPGGETPGGQAGAWSATPRSAFMLRRRLCDEVFRQLLADEHPTLTRSVRLGGRL
jgi:hypothetical protein